MSQISTVYPNSLEGFEDVLDGTLVVMNADYVDVVLLAHDTDALSLLPSAFYWIANSWDNLVSEVAFQGSGNTAESELADFNRLSKADIVQIASGRDRLRKAFHEEIAKYMYEPSAEGCNDKTRCENYKGSVVRSDKWRELQWSTGTRILEQELKGDIRKNTNDLCGVCKRALNMTMEEGLNKVWQQLPEYFGLKDWESLSAKNI